MSKRMLVLGIVLLSVLFADIVFAAVPSSITVQGRLTDSLGVPLPPGVKGFWFRIFDAPTAGVEIWSGEDQFLATDDDGLWSATLGILVGLNDAVFADTVRWLDVTVNGVTLPRVRLRTVPYAHRASTVDGATGGNITSKVSIGPGHTNSGIHAFVAGEGNTVTGNYAIVGGGKGNGADGDYSAVVGGERARASGNHAFVGGGGGSATFDSNLASADHAAIVGGRGNRAEGTQSFIGGGSSNSTSGSFSAAIVGGQGNAVSGLCASVVGGRSNKARGAMSFVGGGGQSNAVPGDSNVALGIASAVVCGIGNSAGDSGAFVGAGRGNDATGKYSMIPGGLLNVASRTYSFAAGLRAKSNHSGTFVWGDSTSSDFASTGTNQFLIRASGGVGIGTNNPDGPLHVQEGSAGAVTGNSSAAAVIERNADTWLHILSPDNTMRGILFGSPANALMGSIRFNPQGSGEEKGYEIRGRNNNILVEIDSLGNLHSRGSITAVGTCCASDERLKRNIQPLPGGLDKITCLRGVSYEWKPDESGERIYPTGQQIGLIAQEVQRVVPEAVNEDEDGYLAVDYARLVPLLIEGMKEQQRIIESQNERITTLERKLEQ